MKDKDIKYVLIARIDGQAVYHQIFNDTYEVQEVGLSDAENTVSMYLTTEDLEPEETSYIHDRKNRERLTKFRGNKDE